MTQKELLYVEDAVGHEQNLIKIATQTISILQDNKLKIFMEGQLKTHEDIKNKLMGLLEGESNEWSNSNGKYVVTS